MEKVTAIFALLPAIFIVLTIVGGMIKKVDVYNAFVKGARQGLATALRILPNMAAMLVAIGVFRAGGALGATEKLLSPLFSFIGAPQEVAPLFALRPFSGSASLAMLDEIFRSVGPDSFAGVVASVVMGSSETVFYTVGIYYAAVGVTKTRYTIPAAMLAQVAALVVSVWACRLLL